MVEEALDEPDRAREAVAALRRTTGDALADLRGTIDLLRTEGTPDPLADPAPAPGLGQLDQLVAGARDSGLDVHLVERVEPDRVRPALGLAAYRVVQEALTNTLRHARAGSAEVVVERRDGGLVVRVTDDGAAPAVVVEGYGLRGMAERVAAAGGRLTHGARTDGPGFAVEAWFPEGGRG